MKFIISSRIVAVMYVFLLVNEKSVSRYCMADPANPFMAQKLGEMRGTVKFYCVSRSNRNLKPKSLG